MLGILFPQHSHCGKSSRRFFFFFCSVSLFISAGINNDSKINHRVYSQTLPASLGGCAVGGISHGDVLIGRWTEEGGVRGVWRKKGRGGGCEFRRSGDTDGEREAIMSSCCKLIKWN